VKNGGGGGSRLNLERLEEQMKGQIGSKATAKVTEEVLASVGRYWT
jgi:hypothetical protein